MQPFVSDPALISFQTTQVLSEKKVRCETVINEDKYVVLFNPANPSEKTQLKMTADSVTAHPTQNILALKGGKTIQIFNLDTSERISKCSFDSSIEYMIFTNQSTLAIITTTSVFHLDITKKDSPQHIFDRQSALNNHVIVNYQVDKSESWCLIHGRFYDVYSITFLLYKFFLFISLFLSSLFLFLHIFSQQQK